MNIKYFDTAWNDIKHSDGWFKKMCLLALIGLIPIFGQIVILGYLFGWAREIAWGVRMPLPERVFANEDGKLYRRGFFILVASFVLSLVPVLISVVGNGLQEVGILAMDPRGGSGGVVMTYIMVGGIVALIGSLLSMFVEVVVWVSSMRISIYDNLSSGFQLKVIWRMMKHDGGGLARIFGMYLLVGLVIGLILTVIAIAGVLVFIGSLFAAGPAYYSADFYGLFAATGIGFILFLLVFSYVAEVVSVFAYALVARAMGYWTCQFDVPRWLGQDDPLPFERQQQYPQYPQYPSQTTDSH